ncbi:ZIP family metal transporter [Sphingobacterium psychroaquaticum]|uniref:ZIP Zinc transporter n=1 Tax=Sphingobacterium psychroaquaticum TaxID=561061 RepID=A0A1X7JQ83_9SPHI|nr:ZIP family metal transporter [Sphingobacterium psychroaquaticum]QBQ40898.1 zinc/iron permease [Sphingobacterium psychroaquaticum]SMG29659.1 ZIP Zinc transporter [Sphingobacterium psychroaquaticum]
MSSFLIVTILFVSALVSGLAVFFVKRDNTNLLKLILSFSGAYLFSITVLHLIPHVYLSNNTSPEIIGLYILGGFLFQLILEQFSQGIEHGHLHAHDHNVFPIGIMVSLCLHAFLEGMPLAAGHQSELVFGIAIHHIPAAFALGSLLINTKLTKGKIGFFILLFAAMTPMGFLTSKGISQGDIGNISQYFDKIMAIVIGIFLHISTTILFESGSADHHKFNKKKMIAVLLGVLVSLSNFLFEGHSHDHGHGHDGHNHQQEQHNHDHDHGHDHDH